jgi:Beta-galactosidase/beta-glucuronidase
MSSALRTRSNYYIVQRMSAYPRASLRRDEWISLDGEWDYAIRPIAKPADSYDGKIRVPFPLEAPLSGAEGKLGPDEALWYRRGFGVPAAWRDKRIMLRFGAVDWDARVSVNGSLAAIHRGGFSSFGCDLTDLLKEADGENELLVEVRDPTDAGTQCRGKQVRESRGIWYTSCSGIWQSVWIEPVSVSHIASILPACAPGSAASEGKLRVIARIESPTNDSARHELRVDAITDGAVIATGRAVFEPGSREAQVEFEIPEPRLWSPESPFIYDLKLDLDDGADKAESYAALRTVEARLDTAGRRRVFLNGEPYFNNAVLDQGYWPEGVYAPPTEAALVADIDLAKKLGFNAIRKHAKVECENWYAHCDRVGMLVWQDIPSGGAPMKFFYSAILGFAGLRLSDERGRPRFGRSDAGGRDDFEREAAEILDRFEFFPCIVAWVPFNEGWGQFDSARIAAKFAKRDPERLVDAASGWYDRGAGDFASRHDYSRKPRMPAAIRGRIAAITEFGGLTLRIEGHSTEDKRQFGYVGAADGEDLARRYEALADRLADLARRGLAASVYTQISDVEIERNGLVTYDRKLLKADESRIRAANEKLIKAGSGNRLGTPRMRRGYSDAPSTIR